MLESFLLSIKNEPRVLMNCSCKNSVTLTRTQCDVIGTLHKRRPQSGGSCAEIFRTRENLQLWTWSLFDAKTFAFFKISGVSAWTRRRGKSRFCADNLVFYRWAPNGIQIIKARKQQVKQHNIVKSTQQKLLSCLEIAHQL